MDAPPPPPAYGYLDDDDDKAAAAKPLEFVLLQKFACFADRNNATTASCELRGPDLRGSIKVTFCVAAPPKVSYFCVHASCYSDNDLDLPPNILAAEGPLVLISAIFPCTSDIWNTQTTEYFVYNAGVSGRCPSLEHLPSPGYGYSFQESSVALLRRCINHSFDATTRGGASQEEHCCDSCGYVIAARCSGIVRAPHDMCLYHSVPGTWSTKAATAPTPYYHLVTHKTVVIGGDNGLVAWVDLENDILLCDVLAESPTVRLVKLPELMPASKGVTASGGDPRSSRDVAVVDGFIKYTQLQIRIVPGSLTADRGVTYDGWKAATWILPIGSTHSALARVAWRKVCWLDSSDCFKSVPNVQVVNDTVESKRIHVGLPVLSLEQDSIVYLLGMTDYRDREACVLAVDMVNKTVQGIAEFGAKNTFGFFGAYVPSRISKFLRVSSFESSTS